MTYDLNIIFLSHVMCSNGCALGFQELLETVDALQIPVSYQMSYPGTGFPLELLCLVVGFDGRSRVVENTAREQLGVYSSSQGPKC